MQGIPNKKLKKYRKSLCWVWPAYKNDKGYASKSIKNVNCYVHRIVYQSLFGEIGEGMTIDHLCKNKACVNPYHLEVVTRGENTLRGDTVSARNKKKTHCPYGHPYSGNNLYIKERVNTRECRECHRKQAREYYKRKKQRGIQESLPPDRAACGVHPAKGAGAMGD